MGEHPGLKQFRQEGCLSYLVFDHQAGEAIVVDPRMDLLDEYREYLAERKLKPVTVVDTRLHWHHLSASHRLSEAFGIPVAMSARTDSERVTRRLEHGDRVRVGRWELEAFATPGTAVDALCLRGPGFLLSGDTLQIGAGARVDLPG